MIKKIYKDYLKANTEELELCVNNFVFSDKTTLAEVSKSFMNYFVFKDKSEMNGLTYKAFVEG